MKTFGKLKLFALACSLFSTSTLMAGPRYLPNLLDGGNEWIVTAYNDTSTDHTQIATQTICFFPAGYVGTHQQYYWVSTSYNDWNGIASQEGDQVFMHGDFGEVSGFGGHDALQWELVSGGDKATGAGHWQEWVQDGLLGINVAFTNMVFKRSGECAYATVEEAMEAGGAIPLKMNVDGKALAPSGVTTTAK